MMTEAVRKSWAISQHGRVGFQTTIPLKISWRWPLIVRFLPVSAYWVPLEPVTMFLQASSALYKGKPPSRGSPSFLLACIWIFLVAQHMNVSRQHASAQ